MSSLIIRPAHPDDLTDLLALAEKAGAGMTTVPNSAEAISERIEASMKAFSGDGLASANEVYYFVLDDGGKAVGMACIFPNLGEDRPFYSYRLSHIAASAPEIGMRADTDALFLVNDFHGYAEVGTLLVGQEARGRGAGRLLSLSRLFYMGIHQHRFGPNVMAEIRGWFDENDHPPFWDHISAKFFHTSFHEADRLSAHDFRFISHLMPKYPIYVALLPKEVQAIIGKAHETSTHARNLLQSEGFFWSKCIDIFDGGPSIECRIDQLRIVQQTKMRSLTVAETAEHIPDAIPLMVSPQPPTDFVAVMGLGHRDGQTVVITPEVAERTGLQNGANVFAAPLKG